MVQEFITIHKSELVAEVTRLRAQGWRLSQISATYQGGYDLLYTLERGYELTNLRVTLADGEAVDSVGAVFPYAFLYENEMKDLFGIGVLGMNVDFAGSLYQTAVKTPFCAGKTGDGGRGDG